MTDLSRRLFQIVKDDAVKVLHSLCQQICKTQQWSQNCAASTPAESGPCASSCHSVSGEDKQHSARSKATEQGSLLARLRLIKFELEDAKRYPGEAVTGKTQAQNHFTGAAHTWSRCPLCTPGARTWGQATHSPDTPELR